MYYLVLWFDADHFRTDVCVSFHVVFLCSQVPIAPRTDDWWIRVVLIFLSLKVHLRTPRVIVKRVVKSQKDLF